MLHLPKWLLHVGIALNTVMFIGFWAANAHKMALISFLSACAFWLNLVIEDRRNNNEE